MPAGKVLVLTRRAALSANTNASRATGAVLPAQFPGVIQPLPVWREAPLQFLVAAWVRWPGPQISISIKRNLEPPQPLEI